MTTKIIKWFGVGVSITAAVMMALIGDTMPEYQLHIFVGYASGASLCAIGALRDHDTPTLILNLAFLCINIIGIAKRIPL